MKPRERIIGALERSPAPGRSLPDRVPVMEMAIDWKIVRGLDCSGYFDLNRSEGIFGDPEELEQFICMPCAETMSAREYYETFVETRMP